MRKQRRLAGAVDPEHADLGARQERQRDVLQDLLAAREDLGQAAHHVDVLVACQALDFPCCFGRFSGCVEAVYPAGRLAPLPRPLCLRELGRACPPIRSGQRTPTAGPAGGAMAATNCMSLPLCAQKPARRSGPANQPPRAVTADIVLATEVRAQQRLFRVYPRLERDSYDCAIAPAAARSARICRIWTTSASTAASIARSVVSIIGKFNASASPRRYAAQQSIREFESSGCPRGPASRAWRTGGAQSSRTTRTRAVRVRSPALRTNDGRVWPSRTYTSAPSGSAAKRSIHSCVVTACHRSGPPKSRYIASADGTPTASK